MNGKRRAAPLSTYRLQLRSGFGFREALAIVPYLQRLGVSHAYLPPITLARAGSTHGYDAIDPTRIDPALGSEADFAALADELHRHGMGLLLDIVPNHLAAASANPWWAGVLEYGPWAEWAHAFDIAWEGWPSWPLPAKILLPVLGGPYGAVLDRGELTLEAGEGRIAVRYFGHRFPLRPESYASILAQAAGMLEGRDAIALARLASAFGALAPSGTPGGRGAARYREEGERLKARLERLAGRSAAVREAIEAAANALAAGSGALDALLRGQHYQLAHWRVAPERVNYRRFFDISDLAGVRAEDPGVFGAMHALVERLLRAGQVDGLRIDHIDGLRDPEEYLWRLKDLCTRAGAPNAYLVVEKILGSGEALPGRWPVAGTTGYDFMGLVTGLFVDPGGMAELDAWQRREAGWSGSFPELARAQKRRLLDELFAGQVDALARGLVALAGGDRQAVDLTASGLRHALLAVTAALPVYRTYATSRGTSPAGRDLLAKALETARAEARVDRRALDFVGRVLSLDVSEAAHEQAQALVMDWQQLTGPAMAKGLEDTALYRDTRLLALDDVGRDPERDLPLTTPDAFHEAMLWRAEGWPRTMNATSTHDTKRSEDVRARIAVLSELAPEWLRELERWRRQNAPLRTMLADGEAPEPAMESLIYQTMLGAWPPAGAAAARGAFRERLRAYVLKAAREAKVRTTWLEPRRAYEEALLSFVDDCLDPARSSTFLGSLDRFAHLVTRAGATNSIAQTLLKLTVPGVPDIYQGTELVDLSLADPDNRRPIDFARRIALLGAMGRADSRRALLRELVRDWPDDRAKLLVTAEALALRQALPAVFEEGAYLPLAVAGERAGHAVAFARRAGEDWVIVVVPRLTARLTRGGRPPIGARPWGDTAVLLPEDAPRLWTDVLSGETRVVSPGRGLAVGELFREFPGALLRAAG